MAGAQTGESGSIRALSVSALAYALAEFARGRDLSEFVREGPSVCSKSKSIVVVVADSRIGERIYDDLSFYLSGSAEHTLCRFFGWEILPFEALSPPSEVTGARLYTLGKLLEAAPTIVVATGDALMQKIISPEVYRRATIRLRKGDTVSRDEIVSRLDQAGYLLSSLVEEPGQMAVRGAIVDVFPPGASHPLRLELFADSLESIRVFDAETQRSSTESVRCEIFPAREAVFFWGETHRSLEETIKIVRRRVSELELPLRVAEELEEALRMNSSWPGIEQLFPLLSTNTSSLFDFIQHAYDLIVIDPAAVFSAGEIFEELVQERSAAARRDGMLFPSPDTAYRSAAEVGGWLRTKLDFAIELSDLITLEGESPLTEKAVRLEILPNSGLETALRRSRHKELPLEPFAEEVKVRLGEGYRVAVTVAHRSRSRRVLDLLNSYELGVQEFFGGFKEWQSQDGNQFDVAVVLFGALSAGVRVPRERLLLISDREIFPDTSLRRTAKSATSVRRLLGALSQIKEGDYVVHIDHGIALYRGLKQLTVEERVGDFLHLEYADGAKLFVPVENIGKVEKYVAAEGARPSLSRLGGKAWEKTKARVKRDVLELAGQLLALYAEREVASGISFGDPNEEDLQFASTFTFEETPDQEKAIAEVLSDMGDARPMDRLVCGDVGYGKTEVALRAAFKAMNSGRQVALLVPTTILADQHYATFRERFADYPFRIACVSRFYPPKENKKTLSDLAEGKVDLVIGTHRLLQRDVFFCELGLLIIDEEHRFGVADKEKLKRYRKEVDVLTLTATPIPRTLHMSLLDIRDLSLIETPPTDRQVIRTYLAPYQGSVVREAVMRELSRGGQVFYVHNRVENIAAVAGEVAELVPEARVAVAHGQMLEDELETVMHRFIKQEIDVLVCTTIIESGLDIPNANTIIIRDADKLGLAQLYQLRGRVGRSSRRAYAYLLFSQTKQLGPEARKRLQVLSSLDDLGMGFRLALQDMEIRGAGNLLGRDQSGKIELVGFELYTRILKEAVQDLRARRRFGRAPVAEPIVDPEIRIGFPAHIPEYYVPDVGERLLLYQRLVDLRDDAEAQVIRAEIEDRFGALPAEVELLLDLMVFRAALRRGAITAASYRNGVLHLTFHKDAAYEPSLLLKTVQESRGTLRLSPDLSLSAVTNLPTSLESPRPLTDFTLSLLERLGH